MDGGQEHPVGSYNQGQSYLGSGQQMQELLQLLVAVLQALRVQIVGSQLDHGVREFEFIDQHESVVSSLVFSEVDGLVNIILRLLVFLSFGLLHLLVLLHEIQFVGDHHVEWHLVEGDPVAG